MEFTANHPNRRESEAFAAEEIFRLAPGKLEVSGTPDSGGLLAITAEIKLEVMEQAYDLGIFPYPLSDHRIGWYLPEKRPVIFLEDMRVPRRLARELRNTDYTFARDRDVRGVILGCARREDESAVHWLVPKLQAAYLELHSRGLCRSYECYDGGELVGGVLLVKTAKAVSAESMFFKRPNASKLAFLHMAEELAAEGSRWIDAQVASRAWSDLGARTVSRDEYSGLLACPH